MESTYDTTDNEHYWVCADTSGFVYVSARLPKLTPTQARRLAANLLVAAHEADGKLEDTMLSEELNIVRNVLYLFTRLNQAEVEGAVSEIAYRCDALARRPQPSPRKTIKRESCDSHAQFVKGKCPLCDG